MDSKEKIIAIIQRIKNILSARPKDIGLVDFLKSIYEEYAVMIATLDDSIARPKMLKEGLIETIDKIEERIFLSIEEYYDGRLLSAIAEIDFLFQDLHLILPDGYNQFTINSNDIWYRGRKINEATRIYPRKEMFHIPNNLRENVSNQRFSFNGYPCLYMGKSIWTCWEELDEPDLDNICFSALKITQNLHIFDLSIPTPDSINNKSIEELVAMLIIFPLSIACTIKTKNEKANFKEEYIIPQLMMIELLEHLCFEPYCIDGFVFTSTKGNSTFGWDDKYLLNMVLPVRGEFDKDGLCFGLKNKILITEPICHKYEILKSNISSMIEVSEEEIDAIFEDRKENDDNKSDIYPRTLFGQMENILKDSEFVMI